MPTTYIYCHEIEQFFSSCAINTLIVDKDVLESVTGKYKAFLDRELLHIISSNNIKRDIINSFRIKFPERKYLNITKDTIIAIKHILFTCHLKYRYIFHLDESSLKKDSIRINILNEDFFRNKKNRFKLDLKEIEFF